MQQQSSLLQKLTYKGGGNKAEAAKHELHLKIFQ